MADLALQSTWRLPNRKAEAADLICTILRQDLACKREMMEASLFPLMVSSTNTQEALQTGQHSNGKIDHHSARTVDQVLNVC